MKEIDVSRCKYYYKHTKICLTRSDYMCRYKNCSDVPTNDCYYKQLQQLKEHCKQIEETNKILYEEKCDLIEENEDLKAFIKELKSFIKELKSFIEVVRCGKDL